MSALAKQPKNVVVGGRRTSLRLEGWCWDALDDIGARERLTRNQLITVIDQRLRPEASGDVSLASSIRVFIMWYYRAAVASAPERADLLHAMDRLLAELQASPMRPRRGRPPTSQGASPPA
jgi:predicted DNA-binding ribbon-helix-helix protein